MDGLDSGTIDGHESVVTISRWVHHGKLRRTSTDELPAFIADEVPGLGTVRAGDDRSGRGSDSAPLIPPPVLGFRRVTCRGSQTGHGYLGSHRGSAVRGPDHACRGVPDPIRLTWADPL